MSYKEIYITEEEYQARCIDMGNLYEGFVIGYGYIYINSFVVQPPHLNGFNPVPGAFYGDETHFVQGYQLVEDRSKEAVKLSLRGLFVNGEAVVTIKYGMTLSHIANLFDIRVEDLVSWNNIKNPNEIYVGQKIKIYKFDVSENLVSSNENWRDTLEFWAGIGGLACSIGQVLGEKKYIFSYAKQYNYTFEAMNFGKWVNDIDRTGKIWRGASNSALVKAAVSSNIPNVSRYYPNAAPYLNNGGKTFGVIGVGLSVWRFCDAYVEDDKLDMLESSVDAIMGGIGFIPKYGWMVSGTYFLSKPLVKHHNKTVVKSQIETGVVGLPSTMPFK